MISGDHCFRTSHRRHDCQIGTKYSYFDFSCCYIFQYSWLRMFLCEINICSRAEAPFQTDRLRFPNQVCAHQEPRYFFNQFAPTTSQKDQNTSVAYRLQLLNEEPQSLEPESGSRLEAEPGSETRRRHQSPSPRFQNTVHQKYPNINLCLKLSSLFPLEEPILLWSTPIGMMLTHDDRGDLQTEISAVKCHPILSA